MAGGAVVALCPIDPARRVIVYFFVPLNRGSRCPWPSGEPGGRLPRRSPGGRLPTCSPGGRLPTCSPGGRLPTCSPGGRLPTRSPGGRLPTCSPGGRLPSGLDPTEYPSRPCEDGVPEINSIVRGSPNSSGGISRISYESFINQSLPQQVKSKTSKYQSSSKRLRRSIIVRRSV